MNCNKCERYHLDQQCQYKWRRRNTIEMGGYHEMIKPLRKYKKGVK